MLQPTVNNFESGTFRTLEVCCHIPPLKEQHRPGDTEKNYFLDVSNTQQALI